jgi:hypothetical protein
MDAFLANLRFGLSDCVILIITFVINFFLIRSHPLDTSKGFYIILLRLEKLLRDSCNL